jgi:hypothetical protein
MFHILVSDTLFILQRLEFQLDLSDIQEYCGIDFHLLMMEVESSSRTFVLVMLHITTFQQIVILVNLHIGSSSINYSFPIADLN